MRIYYFFEARTILLEVEIQERREEKKLTSASCLRLRLLFLLPKLFRSKTFLWLMIFCSTVFSCISTGRLSMYWLSSVALSFLVLNLAILVLNLEFWTRTSGLFGSFMTLVVGLIFPTVCSLGRWLRIIHLDSSFALALHVFFVISWPPRSFRFARSAWRNLWTTLVSILNLWTFVAPLELGRSQRRWLSHFQHWSTCLYLLTVHPWDTICPACYLRLKKILLFLYSLSFYYLFLWWYLKLVYYNVCQSVLQNVNFLLFFV